MQYPFPFSAVIGQQMAKQALMMLAVNDRLQSVLLSGHTGTGKTCLARSFLQLLPAKRRIDIPLNTTEDRLFGSIDLEYALQTGKTRFLPGLLAEAHEQMVVADDIHCMPDANVHAITRAIMAEQYEVERDGFSALFPVRSLLIATINPEEGELANGVLDQFGLYVSMDEEKDQDMRQQIVRNWLDYEHHPQRFAERMEADTRVLRTRIEEAKVCLAGMHVSESMLELAALTVLEANCAGLRADYVLIEGAKAIAALSGKMEVKADHIRQAASFVLVHRMRSVQNSQQPQPQEQPNRPPSGQNGGDDETPNTPEQQQQTSSSSGDHRNDTGTTEPDELNKKPPSQETPSSRETVEAIGQMIRPGKLLFHPKDVLVRIGTGKRSQAKSGTKQGRYVKARFPQGELNDIAFDATLRAAAPYQRMRPSKPETVWNITNDDIRHKVREKRIGVTMMFVVDASRSMAAQKRMQAVKGAILSLLQDAYQKRDRIGMIAFRQDQAEEIVPITRSVHLAEQRLRTLPTGGQTPLSLGLKRGFERLRQAVKRDPEIVPVMIVLTDGKANVGLQPGGNVQDLIEESRRMAEAVHHAGIQSLVIDTEQGFVKLQLAKKLAEAMCAQYVPIEQLDEAQLVMAVRTMLNA